MFMYFPGTARVDMCLFFNYFFSSQKALVICTIWKNPKSFFIRATTLSVVAIVSRLTVESVHTILMTSLMMPTIMNKSMKGRQNLTPGFSMLRMRQFKEPMQ